MNLDMDFFFPETVLLESATGEAKGTLRAQIDTPNKLIIHGDQVAIETDDVIVHKLGNGATQRYSVLDAHYQRGHQDLPAITTLTVHKHGTKAFRNNVNLGTLAVELEQLRTELRKVASSREDDKQVALLAEAAEEAEKGNGTSVAAILSGAGPSVLKMARDFGTDVAAKVIAELVKG